MNVAYTASFDAELDRLRFEALTQYHVDVRPHFAVIARLISSPYFLELAWAFD